mgnify:CR=1 FL=1
MINAINNYTAWYDTSRPFPFMYQSNNNNTINIVYVLEIQDPITLTWGIVTNHLKQPIEWDMNFWLIDVSQLCTDFVRWEIAQDMYVLNSAGITGNNWSYGKNHRIKCRLVMTEETINSQGELSYNQNINNWQRFSEFYAIDGGVDHEDTWLLPQHEFYKTWHILGSWNGRDTCKFMTDQPLVTQECIEDDKIISFGADIRELQLYLNIYREDGTVHTDVPVSYPTEFYGVNQFGIGAPQIKSLLDDLGILNSFWSATNGWAKFEYRMVRTYPWADVSETYTSVFTTCGCSEEHVRLWWRNNRNGVDCYTFKGTHSIKILSKYKRFQSPLGHRRHRNEDTTTSGYSWYNNNTFNQQSSGTHKVNVDSNKRMKIYSGWETKETLEWLSNIINSTEVFVQDKGSNLSAFFWKLTPVIVRSPSFQEKKRGSSLSKIELELEYANPKTTNRI